MTISGRQDAGPAPADGGGRPGDWTPVAPGAAPAVAAPPAGECHLWPVPVMAPEPDAERRAAAEGPWLALLAREERERAAGYRADHARRIFITSRATQRIVAACYLGRPPAEIRVARACRRCGDADHGRPSIVDAALDISVTHAGQWLMLAVVGTGRVGVDLEQSDQPAGGPARSTANDLAELVLAPTERVEFDRLAEPDRRVYFYRCWTRKEATAKLTGHGLTVRLGSLDVRADRALITAGPDDWPDGPIHLTDAPAPAGYAAALASSVALDRVSFFSARVPTHRSGGVADG